MNNRDDGKMMMLRLSKKIDALELKVIELENIIENINKPLQVNDNIVKNYKRSKNVN